MRHQSAQLVAGTGLRPFRLASVCLPAPRPIVCHAAGPQAASSSRDHSKDSRKATRSNGRDASTDAPATPSNRREGAEVVSRNSSRDGSGQAGSKWQGRDERQHAGSGHASSTGSSAYSRDSAREGVGRAQGQSQAPEASKAPRAPMPPRAAATATAASSGNASAAHPAAKPPRISKAEAEERKRAKVAANVAEEQKRKRGCCYGCGAVLQIEVPLGPGYVDPSKYEMKQKHKQLDKVLCVRCSGLCNGAMIPAVEDFTQKQHAQALLASEAATEAAVELLGKALVTPEQLRTQLLAVADAKAVVVMLVDLTDVSGTLMGKVRDMVGRNPIVLVGTKMDLLPAGSHPKPVADWLLEAALRKRLNAVSVHLVSSHTGEGVSAAVGAVRRERRGRDVYVVGAANVGKSAFVRAMLKDMSKYDGGNYDAAAMAQSRYLPVESPMPGTTLGLIALRAFGTGGMLYDTPGVHLHHRVPHMLSPEELKILHPRKRLAPVVPPSPRDAAASAGISGTSYSASYEWGGLVRVDVLGAPASTRIAFYGPTTMRVHAQPLAASAAIAPPDTPAASGEQPPVSAPETDAGSNSGTGPSSSGPELWCAGSVIARGGRVPHELVVKVAPGTGGVVGRPGAPLADIAVSGLPGWVSIWAPGARRDLKLRVWAPKGVEVFLRPPLPCSMPDWADDKDDDEDEEELGGLGSGALAALAAEYEMDGGSRGKGKKARGAADLMQDAAWWEAAVKEMEAIGDDEEDDEMSDGEEEEEGRKVTSKRRGGLLGARARARATQRREEEEEDDEFEDADQDGDGEEQEGRSSVGRKSRAGRVVVSATVEDILKRPRLEQALSGLGLDGDGDEGEEGGQDEEGVMAGSLRGRAGKAGSRGARPGGSRSLGRKGGLGGTRRVGSAQD